MPQSRASGPMVRLIAPGNVLHNSGGNAYNAALARGLTALGAEVEICRVDGHWPVGSGEERRRLARTLLGGAARSRESVTIVDGLVALGAPGALEEAAAAGRPAWILLHMALEEHPDLEERALAAAAGVICASSTAATALRARYSGAGYGGARYSGAGYSGAGYSRTGGVRRALPPIHAAPPGTNPAPLAGGSEPPHLVSVAALLPNKDQLLLLAALADLKDLPWSAALVGSDSADPVYAEEVRSTVTRLGLAGRVAVRGELTGQAFAEEWHRADLSLLVSRVETYGMVVTESLAHGIPVVVRNGTGAVEALAAGSPDAAETSGAEVPDGGGAPALPGAAVVLDTDPAPLAAVLRRWLTDRDLREQWREAAVAARTRLPGWDVTARTVLDIVAGPR